jgi:hypothetical protein
MTSPSGNAGGVGYVGISKATDASMIISEAMSWLAIGHENTACGSEAGSLVVNVGTRLYT